MKLWDKGFDIDKGVEQFTVGLDKQLDTLLATWDVLGSMAHCIMLHQCKLLSNSDIIKIIPELRNMYLQIESDGIQLSDSVEDIHSQIEFDLTAKIGEPGKKIHMARSRNDQVLLDIRLFTRNRIEAIALKTQTLFHTLIQQSEKYKNVLLPGYTHLQIAMPSSFGLWFGAFAENLTDDLNLLLAAWQCNNQNPLGSAAGYGSSFPINRELTTKLLGFDNLNFNVVHAQMTRGKYEAIVAFAISQIAGTLARFASDACMYMSQNFAFISLPNNLTTGSSIMPHKANPDVFEILRAKCNKISAATFEIQQISRNLTSGYFRDMQIIKETYFSVFSQIIECIDFTNFIVPQIVVNTQILSDKKYNLLFTVEEVNAQVLNGVSFRDAYKATAEKIKNNSYQFTGTLNHTHQGTIGNLCNKQITDKLNSTLDSFGFDKVHKAIDALLNNKNINN